MASDLEEQKKAILPFMQRAQEIQQTDPKVAYYCRMYAVDQALKLPQRAKEVTALLSATLNQLERDKAQIKLDPAADRIHCLGFALRIFDNADRVDRAGRATERTAVAYYAASVFMEILYQFEGGVDADLLEKQRYCAWRAAEIRKALREGRKPTPPPSATPLLAATPEGGNAATSADLPPASGSSAWAYGGQSQSHAMMPPPVPPVPPGGEFGVGGEGFGSADSSFRSTGGDSFLCPRPPAPSVSSSSGRSESPMATTAAAMYGSAARFWPGAKLHVHTEEGLDDGSSVDGIHRPGTLVGTVGQVVRRPDGGFSYKVALTDRLVEVPEEAAVAALREGDVACLAPGPQQTQPCLVKVLIINCASWPPTYLVQTPDGKEQAVTAQQLMLPPRDGVTVATSTTAVPAPPPAAPAPSAPPPPMHPQQSSPSPAPPSPPRAPSPPAYPSYGGDGDGVTPPGAGPYPPGGAVHHPPPSHAAGAYPYPAPTPTPSTSTAIQGYVSAAPPPSTALPPGYRPPVQMIMDAQKQAKYAVSALSFEDIHTAVKHLSEALRLLTSIPPPSAAASATMPRR